MTPIESVTQLFLAPKTVRSRDGESVAFDAGRIENAIAACFSDLGTRPNVGVSELTKRVVNLLYNTAEPTIEQIQDRVEMVLMSAGEFEAAKHYVIYREAHALARTQKPISRATREAFDSAATYFPTALQQFQFFDKYSRFDYDKGRRETWVETVDRAVAWLTKISGNKLKPETYARLRQGILDMKVMPSMRLLAMAGPAADYDNTAIYNCSYFPVDSLDSFVAAMVISMNGCGVGFSVESRYINQLPPVKRFKARPGFRYQVEDSSEGWADALRFGLDKWFEGEDTIFDYSLVRPSGTPLQKKGGRASGPGPLKALLDFARERILARAGSYIRPIDAHDIMCKIGEASIAGATRRTAMISLFDFDDVEMRQCKDGDFEAKNSQRWNANNSAVWPDRGISQVELLEQFLDMVKGGRGEPGIFNRAAAVSMAPARRLTEIDGEPIKFGTNPCGEIILRPYQFCNLTAAVCRSNDTFDSLLEKVELATILGTIQSMATYFPNLPAKFKENCEAERLLGVDITGQMDCPAIQDAATMGQLRDFAVATNKTYAEILGIPQSASVTCVKPSGNSSQLLNCASGLHARWADYYIRNVRVQATSPLYPVLRDAGVPLNPENGQIAETATVWVASFPTQSPEGAITRNGRSAVEQCDYWLLNKLNWTEHNPSVTITYREHEIMAMLGWIWEHHDQIGGMAFLPAFDAQYAQLPYIEVTKAEYEKAMQTFPEKIDYSRVTRHEHADLTQAAMELACSSGQCEVDF